MDQYDNAYHLQRNPIYHYFRQFNKMTMSIKIIGAKLSKSTIENLMPFVVVSDNNGKQLIKTKPQPGQDVRWEMDPFFCMDTLDSIMFSVYHKEQYRQNQLIGIGKFDFKQGRDSPYEKLRFNIPVALQNVQVGNIQIEVYFNEGQIFIGQSKQMQMGSVVHRLRSSVYTPNPQPKSIKGSNISDETAPAFSAPHPQMANSQTPRVITAISSAYSMLLPQTQDGLIQLQMGDFYPTYNIFSIWDVHPPGTQFCVIQPHIRRVYYD